MKNGRGSRPFEKDIMEKVYCVNCKHFRKTIWDLGQCTNSELIEKYTKVISHTSHITGKTNNYRVYAANYEQQIVVEDGISTIFGNGSMNCKYYETKPPHTPLHLKIVNKIRKIFGE